MSFHEKQDEANKNHIYFTLCNNLLKIQKERKKARKNKKGVKGRKQR